MWHIRLGTEGPTDSTLILAPADECTRKEYGIESVAWSILSSFWNGVAFPPNTREIRIRSNMGRRLLEWVWQTRDEDLVGALSHDEQLELVDRVHDILRNIKFLDYIFYANRGHGGVYLQANYQEPDIYSGRKAWQHTRKWLISPQMTDSEIVQTAFKLCLTSAEHKTRENFTYKGARIFGPHFDVEDLTKLCHSGREDGGGRSFIAPNHPGNGE